MGVRKREGEGRQRCAKVAKKICLHLPTSVSVFRRVACDVEETRRRRLRTVTIANKHTDTHTHSYAAHTHTHTGHIHCVSFEPHIECKWRKFKLQTNNFRKMCDVNFVSHFFYPFLAIPLAPACHTHTPSNPLSCLPFNCVLHARVCVGVCVCVSLSFLSF